MKKKSADKAAVYIIGAYQRRLEFREFAEQLVALGHTIASQWIYGPEQDEGALTQQELADIAEANEQDMLDADIAIAFTEPKGSPYTRGGRHFEFGYMVASDFCPRVIVVGRRENIFYHLPSVEQFDTAEQLLEHLKGA